MKAREIRLARRPAALLVADDFEIVETDLAEPNEGEVRVRNLWMSLDPYMRLSLSQHRGVHAGTVVGSTMGGAAVGIVETSRCADLPVGSHVLSPAMGWREAYVASGGQLQKLPGSNALSYHLGVLGMTGITAYVGIELVLKPEPGETILISGAAGAVGSIACQLAKHRGSRVLGIAGSADKVTWLRDTLGVDAALNYKTESLSRFLIEHCPNGPDAYFDNVGGAILDGALVAMRPFGRAAICGAIAQYNDDNYRAGPQNFFTIVEKCITMTGFNVGAYSRQSRDIVSSLTAMLEAGKLIAEETVVEKIESVPAAFVSLFEGANLGKMVVRL